jgi:hypothetical protein
VNSVRIAVLALCAAALLPAQDWKPLFDGKSLTGWKKAAFNRGGEPVVRDGAIVLVPGGPLTGINYTGELPKSNYEVRFEAMRVRGNDFFASLTFPVKDSFATWVTGGWGGDIVGLSSIDEWDASENETRAYFTFEPKQWYSFRLRVTDRRISAWIGEERAFDVSIEGRRISLRPGPIELSVPFGFASYNTEGVIRNIQYRVITP